MTDRLKILKEKYMKGFFGFWVKYYRISYIIILGIVVLGISSLINIPKESSPEINLGIITITTVYPGANPGDIDSTVTDKIYKEIKDINGIDSINTTSSLSLSSLIVNLKSGIESKDVVNEIRNRIGRITLPEDAESPVITDIDSSMSQVFTLYFYPKDKNTSRDLVIEKANILKKKLENIDGIDSVKFSKGSVSFDIGLGGGGANEYDINIVISPDKIKDSGLTIDNIASTIKAWNKDIPIGNYTVGEKNYDFRIEGKYKDLLSLLQVPLQLNNGTYIKLGDIATIEREYKDKTVNLVGKYNENESYPYVSLQLDKNSETSIFKASNNSKKLIEELFNTKEFSAYSYEYGNDVSASIIDDYKTLAREAIITLSIVFLVMFLFIGLKDSIFTTFTLPLAFFCTFIILDKLGYTLNFLTNFCLILSFGIAVDTIIVIIQAAGAKIRVGYDADTAIILALKEYARPLSSGILVTIVAFVAMMFLPGVMGKFFAYVPITILGVLASGLILVLTVNSAIYLVFVKNKNEYLHDDTAIEYASDEEKELLALERENKKEINRKTISLRVKVITGVIDWYKRVLTKFLKNAFLRRIGIIIPVILFVLSIVFLLPNIKTELFPTTDNNQITASIKGPNGITTEVMTKKIIGIENILNKYEEVNFYSINIDGNVALITLDLYPLNERKKKKMMDAFGVENLLAKDLETLKQEGFEVSSHVVGMGDGMMGGSVVGIKLIASESDKLSELIAVSKDFEKELKRYDGTKGITNSSADTPGQFVFTLKKDVLGTYNIPPAVVYSYMLQMMNGINIGSIEDNGTDMNIYVKQSNFIDKVNVEDIMNASFSYAGNNFILGNFVDYSSDTAVQAISRKDGKITIDIGADVEEGVNRKSLQNQIEEFAKSYNFPTGISWEKGGENEENSEFVNAMISAFFIAMLVIFAILTLQFNSFLEPIIIFYSVIMAVPVVLFGLLVTNNPISVTFGVGFISFTGIAINHGILLIDAISINLNKGMGSLKALVEAGASRLEPMTLTTCATAFGILPIALRDKFWSGMGFTIIFGIIGASFLTLFVLKGLYYELFLRKEKNKKS